MEIASWKKSQWVIERKVTLFWTLKFHSMTLNKTILRPSRMMRNEDFKSGFMIFGHL
jgi:hypothetical protein